MKRLLRVIAISFISFIGIRTFADTPVPPAPPVPIPSPTVILLEDIDQTVQVLKNIATTLNAIAASIFSLPQDVGQYIATLQNLNLANQDSADLTQTSTNTLAQFFQSQGSYADTVNHAYNLSVQGDNEYPGLSAYSLLGLAKFESGGTTGYSATYNDDQAKSANVYATFLSGAALAMQQNATATTLKDKQQANLVRTLAAIQSLDAYNVSKIYASRFPSIDAQQNGITIPTPNGKVSQLELVRYQLQQNIGNPAWFTQMSTASNSVVLKQILFTLAGGVSELYRIEQNQEQLLLTQTATNTATIAMAQSLMQAMNQAQSVAPS